MLLDWFLCLYLRTEQGSRRQETSFRRRCGIARLTVCLLKVSPDRSREVAMVTDCWANRRTDLHLVRWHSTTDGRIATRMHALAPPKTPLRLVEVWYSNPWVLMMTRLRTTFAMHFGLIVFARWRLCPTVDAHAKYLVSVGESARPVGSCWLCHASRFVMLSNCAAWSG